MLSILSEEIRARTAGSVETARAIQRALPQFLLLIQDQDSGPSSSAHRLKQQVEDLNISLSGTDPQGTAYARLVAIDDRLDEAESLISIPSLEDVVIALDAARQGLGNIGNDIGSLHEPASDTDRALHGKFEMLNAREAALRLRLRSVQAPVSAVPNESSGMTTSTVEIIIPTSSIPVAVTTTKPVVASKITLTATPDPGSPQTPVQLTVVLTHPDGTTSDVTALSQFLLIDGIGSMNGPVFLPTAAGLAHIQAITQDAGTTLRTVLEINIK
jgi:hypothetical protein